MYYMCIKYNDGHRLLTFFTNKETAEMQFVSEITSHLAYLHVSGYENIPLAVKARDYKFSREKQTLVWHTDITWDLSAEDGIYLECGYCTAKKKFNLV